MHTMPYFFRNLTAVLLWAWQINFEGEDVGEDYFCPLSLTVRRGSEERDLIPPSSSGALGVKHVWASRAGPHAALQGR